MAKRDGLRMKLRGELKMDESTPGWQDRVLDKSLGASKSDPNKKKHGNDMYFQSGKGLKTLLNLAAEKRGVSKSTYARRALAAFIAHDLDITPEQVLDGGPRPCAWGKTGADVHQERGDKLEGYGHWRIGALHE